MITRKRIILALMALCMCNTYLLFAGAPSFQGLGGNNPGVADPIQATGVSADGSTVVGAIGSEAFVRTEAKGIRRLGDLPGGALSSIAIAVSADGSVVAGVGTSSGVARRWTGELRFLDVNDSRPISPGTRPPEIPRPEFVYEEWSIDVGKAFRWTESEGMVQLYDGNEPAYVSFPSYPPYGRGKPAYFSRSAAYGVSGDASVIVGSVKGTVNERQKAVRWTADGQMEILFGQEPHSTMDVGGAARGVSPDGTIIVGELSRDSRLSGDGFYESQAVYWSSFDIGGAIQGLGHVVYGAKWHAGIATNISADANTVVGYETWSLVETTNADFTESTSLTHALMWDWGTGIHDLGTLNDRPKSMAYAVSGDGAIIVGESYSPRQDWVGVDPNNLWAPLWREIKVDQTAFIWDEADGMRDLKGVLETKYGLDLRDWRLTSATGISADGRTIVGNGVHRVTTAPQDQGTGEEKERIEAWIVRLP